MTRVGWGDFVIWQCSLRQRNFRMFGGKPSDGTIASFSDIKSNKDLGDVRSILLENNCINTSKMFEFMQKQTHDPETRFDKAIKFFLLNIIIHLKILMVLLPLHLVIIHQLLKI